MVSEPDLVTLADQAAAGAGGLDPALLAGHLPIVVEVAATGRRITKPELERYRRTGQLAAERGVALRALVELYLSATWRLWPLLPAVTAATDTDAVIGAGQAVLRSADDGVAALTEGYQLARQTVARRQDAERREFFDDLLSGSADLASLVNRAAGFGVDLAAPHAVAVVHSEHGFADATPLIGQLERAILGRRGDANALLATKEGRLVVIFAAPDRAAVDHVTDQLALTLTSGSATRTRRGIGRWRIATGRAHRGPTGVRSSYEDARSALELAGRLNLSTPTVAAADLLVYEVILRDRAAITDLVASLLAPLAEARGGAEPLLETLEAYFSVGANIAATARRLHLSVRAVSYRLRRIADLIGHDPLDPREHLALHVAVAGARLLDWPAGNPAPA